MTELPIESIEIGENHGKFGCVLIVGKNISMESFKAFLTQIKIDRISHITISHLAEGPCTNIDLLNAANEHFIDTAVKVSLDDQTLEEKLINHFRRDILKDLENSQWAKAHAPKELGALPDIRNDHEQNVKWYNQFGRKKGKGKFNRY